MSERDDGGPAFPTEPRFNTETTDAGQKMHLYAGHYGMTLRDWFAGMALGGIVASQGFTEAQTECDATQEQAAEFAAKFAYMLSDAMIRESRK